METDERIESCGCTQTLKEVADLVVSRSHSSAEDSRPQDIGFILIMVKEDAAGQNSFEATRMGDAESRFLSMEVVEHNMTRKTLVLSAIRLMEAVLRHDGVVTIASATADDGELRR